MNTYAKRMHYPRLPDDMVQQVLLSRDAAQGLIEKTGDGWCYRWMEVNASLRGWLDYNINGLMHWFMHTHVGPVHRHRDEFVAGGIKLMYVVDPGQEGVVTRWYEDGQVAWETVLQPHTWYVMRVDLEHDVINMHPTHARMAIGGKKLR